MNDPDPPHRISLFVRGRPTRLRRLLAGVALALASTACGGGDAPEEGAGDPAAAAPGPGDTEVFVGSLSTRGDSLVVGELRNVTGRPGYDNQPAFMPDGSGILYTAIDSAGRADIWRYDLHGRRTRVTETSPESEYSPTPMPTGGAFSAVVVEPDSTQRLWRYPYGGGAPSVLFRDVAPVGYHAWAGEEWVVMFVLGDPSTLQVAGGKTADVREVARDVGRSIQTIPREPAVSFVQRVEAEGEESGGTRIMRWSAREGVTPITDALDGGEFHAWTPDGTLLMGSGDRIMAWRQGWEGWRAVGTAPGGGSVSRLAVSPTGTHLAVVIGPPDGG